MPKEYIYFKKKTKIDHVSIPITCLSKSTCGKDKLPMFICSQNGENGYPSFVTGLGQIPKRKTKKNKRSFCWKGLVNNLQHDGKKTIFSLWGDIWMNLTPASGNVSGSEPSVFNRWSMQIHRQHRDFWSSAGEGILTWFLFTASPSGVLQLFLNWASLIIHELPCMFGPGTCLTPCWQRLETCLQISSVFTSVAEIGKKNSNFLLFCRSSFS